MIRPLVSILAALLLGAPSGSVMAQDVIYALPDDDARLQLKDRDPMALRQEFGIDDPGLVFEVSAALERAEPGSTIRLLPGRYVRKRCLALRGSGDADRPTVIRGRGPDTEIVFHLAPEAIQGAVQADSRERLFALPSPDLDGGAQPICIDRQVGLVIEDLAISTNAQSAIHARDSAYIKLRRIVAVGGRHFFYAEGGETHHLLVEKSSWVQDRSGDMWHRNHWCEYKHPLGRLRHQNGAFFGSDDVRGSVVIRDNVIRHAFNAIRMDISNPLQEEMKKNETLRDGYNTNVEIYRNRFEYIRDNIVEPEFSAANWWFYENTILNAHAWFSLDGLYGGDWFIFGNKGYFDSKPSQQCEANDRCRTWPEREHDFCVREGRPVGQCRSCQDPHAGGKVLKFRKGGAHAPGPLYVFNNSWYLRSSLAKKGKFGRLRHWNNAIEYCRPDDHPDGSCDGPRPFFRKFTWDADDYEFGFDLSNHPDFPHRLGADPSGIAYDARGIPVRNGGTVFRRPVAAGLSLDPNSGGIGAGCRISRTSTGSLQCLAAGPGENGADIGANLAAIERGRMLFRHFDNGTYAERPRIIHVDWPPPRAEARGPRVVRVLFSVPVTRPSEARVAIVPAVGKPPVESQACEFNDNLMTCAFAGAAEFPTHPPARLLLPEGIVGTGADALPLTLWAREPAIVAVDGALLQ